MVKAKKKPVKKSLSKEIPTIKKKKASGQLSKNGSKPQKIPSTIGKRLAPTTHSGSRTDLRERVVIPSGKHIVDITLDKNMNYVFYFDDGPELVTTKSLVHIPGYRLEYAGKAYDDDRTAVVKRMLDNAELILRSYKEGAANAKAT